MMSFARLFSSFQVRLGFRLVGQDRQIAGLDDPLHLAGIEPQAAAARAGIDLHLRVRQRLFLQVAVAARAEPGAGVPRGRSFFQARLQFAGPGAEFVDLPGLHPKSVALGANLDGRSLPCRLRVKRRLLAMGTTHEATSLEPCIRVPLYGRLLNEKFGKEVCIKDTAKLESRQAGNGLIAWKNC